MSRSTAIMSFMCVLTMLPLLSGCLDEGENGVVKTDRTEVGSSGGTYTLLDGQVVLEVPPVDTGFSLESGQAKDVPSDPGLLDGSAVILEPDRDLNTTCKLTMRYDSSKLPDGVDEKELVIGKVVGDLWAGIRTSRVDVLNHTVSVAVTKFSTFGIMFPKGPRIGPVHSRVLPGQSVKMRVYQEPLSGGTLEYEWTCTDKVGGFNKYNKPGRYATYQSEQDKEGEEKVSVEVFEKVGDRRIPLGTAHALIEVRNTVMMLTPALTMMDHDKNMTYTAFFVPELDDTISLRIQWWNTGKNGILTDGLSKPNNYLETPVRSVFYMAGHRGGYWDKIEAQVNIDMGSGMGGFKENALQLGYCKADVYVFDIIPKGIIPHRDYWGASRGNVSLSTYLPKPGEKVAVTVTWDGPEEEMVLFCARAVSVSGSYSSGPHSHNHPSLGGMHKGGPDVLDCTDGGISVMITKEMKSVVFEIDRNITRSELIHTWSPNEWGGTTYYGCAVILWTGGTYAWGSGRLFEIDASGIIPPLPK